MSHFSSRVFRLIFAAMVAVLLAGAVMATPAFAKTELAVVNSAPAADESAAPTSGRYWVQFANNVAAVESNVDCVSLRTADGKEVPAKKCTVSLPDVEIEFGYRQYVWLDVKGLDAGTKYVIHVDGSLTAKNGNVLGSDVDIAFTTAAKGAKAAALATPSETEAGSGNGNGGGSGASESSGTSGGTEVVDLTPKTETASDPVPVQVVAMFIVMLLVVVVLLIIRIRKARRM